METDKPIGYFITEGGIVTSPGSVVFEKTPEGFKVTGFIPEDPNLLYKKPFDITAASTTNFPAKAEE